MKILFAAPENAWGGFLGMLRSELPDHQFEATGGVQVASLADTDVLIPTMCPVTADMLADSGPLRLIQQCGAGLEGVDLEAAAQKRIWVANVPTDISGNADSVAEIGIYLMIGLARQQRQMAPNLSAGKMGEPQGMSLKGRTVGIVGLGGIGCALASRLAPFGVRLTGIKRSGLNLEMQLQNFVLDREGKNWKADLAYKAVTSKGDRVLTNQTVSGSAERLKIVGTRDAEKLLGEIFSDMVNKLDPEKLFNHPDL